MDSIVIEECDSVERGFTSESIKGGQVRRRLFQYRLPAVEKPSVTPDLTRLELATCACCEVQSRANIAHRIEGLTSQLA